MAVVHIDNERERNEAGKLGMVLSLPGEARQGKEGKSASVWLEIGISRYIKDLAAKYDIPVSRLLRALVMPMLPEAERFAYLEGQNYHAEMEQREAERKQRYEERLAAQRAENARIAKEREELELRKIEEERLAKLSREERLREENLYLRQKLERVEREVSQLQNLETRLNEMIEKLGGEPL